jgi:methyl-accepting chemotaxis protein
MPRDDAPVPAAIEPLPADASGPPELEDAATLYRRIERTFFGTLTRKLVANLAVPLAFSAAAVLATGLAWRAAPPELAATLAIAAGLAFTAVASTIGVGLYLWHLFVRPIRHATDSLEQMSSREGNLAQKLRPETQDELAQLAHAFNRLQVGAERAGRQCALAGTIFEESKQASSAVAAVASSADEIRRVDGEPRSERLEQVAPGVARRHEAVDEDDRRPLAVDANVDVDVAERSRRQPNRFDLRLRVAVRDARGLRHFVERELFERSHPSDDSRVLEPVARSTSFHTIAIASSA